MSFASPLFLIGLVAVAIPILVHLFNFRRYRKVYFSNVDRLEQLQSETRRQSTLRQLLILAARILAIVFLVLAFARPVISNGNRRGGIPAAQKNDVSIFIDNSFSMENSDGNGILLDKAKAKAREIVAAYGPSDRFQLLTCDVEGRHFHWLSREEMLSMIDEVQVTGNTAMIDDIAQRQFDFLHGSPGNNHYAFIISDFQTSAFDADAMPVDSTIDLTFVPLASASHDNVFIDSVAFGAPAFHRGNSVAVKVWLCNEGDENLDKVPVSLFVNDRQRALATVDLPARSTSTVDLHFACDEKGILSGRIETEDYPIDFDNTFYFSLNIRDRVDVLLVEGAANNPFITSLYDGDSSVRLNTMALRQMDFSNLEGHDMIILDELPSISSGMAQTLLSFTQQGGTVVVVVSDQADVNSYNAALSLFSAPHLAGKQNGRATAATINMDNALFANVFNGRSDDMELPTVNGYKRLQSSASALSESVITLVGGDDYITHTPCGEGHLYIIAAPLRDANTDFVRQALFVPTLYNMALYSVRPTAPSATLGQEQSLPLAYRYEPESHLMVAPHVPSEKDVVSSHEFIPDIRTTGGLSRLVTHDVGLDAGNYTLSQDGEPREGLSFNYSRIESRMLFMTQDDLEKIAKDQGLDNVSVVPNPDKPLDNYLRERMEGRTLWRLCLILSLLMLLTEILLLKIKIKSKTV
ncbi:MAG: BatA and WFA domain-containing protein [Bacteroidales bacterium]|nr:BatA and WFA domain-containing protein [Bacteroidales bacterium]